MFMQTPIRKEVKLMIIDTGKWAKRLGKISVELQAKLGDCGKTTLGELKAVKTQFDSGREAAKAANKTAE